MKTDSAHPSGTMCTIIIKIINFTAACIQIPCLQIHNTFSQHRYMLFLESTLYVRPYIFIVKKKTSQKLICKVLFLITLIINYSSQHSSSSEQLSFEQFSLSDSYSNKSGKNISSSVAADAESAEP